MAARAAAGSTPRWDAAATAMAALDRLARPGRGSPRSRRGAAPQEDGPGGAGTPPRGGPPRAGGGPPPEAVARGRAAPRGGGPRAPPRGPPPGGVNPEAPAARWTPRRIRRPRLTGTHPRHGAGRHRRPCRQRVVGVGD